MPTKNLIDVLKTLKKAFPSLKQISSYGRAQTMVKKSASDMKEIHDAGLNMLYSGMESVQCLNLRASSYMASTFSMGTSGIIPWSGPQM